MLHSLLHNLKSVNAEQDGSDILKVQYYVKVPAFIFNEKLILGWVKSRTLKQGSGIFWLNSVFWHINAFSGVSLTSPGLQTTDFKLRGRPTSDWQKARQRALEYECGPYPVGSWKTDAGRTAERQSGVRWDKHSLMSRACQGLSHDYTRVERGWGAFGAWDQAGNIKRLFLPLSLMGQ